VTRCGTKFLTAIVVDTSAIYSILLLEKDSEAFAKALSSSSVRHVSAGTLLEAFCAVRRPALLSLRRRLQPRLDHLDLNVSPFNAHHLLLAQTAYSHFGHGSGHAAGLNMGDCFSYALAKSLDLPLLFKGNDFIHIDVRPALTAFL
jgi:ribonuclease VapC